MKKTTDNKQLYKDTFDQIKLSEDAYRQIRNMEETRMDRNFGKKTKRRAGFAAKISLAALAVIFLSANAIAYAATGDSLIETVIGRVTVYINGEPAGQRNLKYGKDKDGNPYYVITADPTADPDQEESTSADMSAFIAEPAATDEQTGRDKAAASAEKINTSVKQKKNKIFLIIEQGKETPIEIDITKDYADGRADGIFHMDGKKYQYRVTGTVEEYSVNLETEDY